MVYWKKHWKVKHQKRGESKIRWVKTTGCPPLYHCIKAKEKIRAAIDTRVRDKKGNKSELWNELY